MGPMSSIQVCSIRSRHLTGWIRALRPPPKLLSPPALLGAWVVLSSLAAFLPRLYVAREANRAFLVWQHQAHEAGKAIVQVWTSALPVPGFVRGNEPEVRDRLEADPLLMALVEPLDGVVWFREGARLRRPRAGEAEEVRRMVGWAREAATTGQPTWIPPVEDNPRAFQEANLVLATGSWWEIKRWVPSGPDTERFIGRLLGPEAAYRFAITRYRRDPGAGSEHNLNQPMPPKSLADSETRPTFAAQFPDLSFAFHEPWVVGLWGTPEQDLRARRDLQRWTRQAWSAHAFFVVLLGAGCLVQFFLSRRDRDRADQLAFLAHSLKTPLTILKLRCDTIRNANLSRDLQDSHLARIGDEVDRLVRAIEAGLDGAKPKGDFPSQDRIDKEVFQRLQEQIQPIFASEGRTLVLEAEEVTFRAPLRALRPALNTLLENALLHGEGTVTLRVHRRGRRVEIQVSDEGRGIPLERFSGLIDAEAQREGAGRVLAAGQGMGIFLLHRMAVHEGWGLRFDAVGAERFRAVLEMPI